MEKEAELSKSVLERLFHVPCRIRQPEIDKIISNENSFAGFVTRQF